MNHTEAIWEICVSPNRSDLFEIFKDVALNSGLEYSGSSTMLFSDAVDQPSNLLSKNIMLVTAVPALAKFSDSNTASNSGTNKGKCITKYNCKL